MKKMFLIMLFGTITAMAGAQTFGTDGAPNAFPGRPEGSVTGGAGAPVAEGVLVAIAVAGGYALLRRRKDK